MDLQYLSSPIFLTLLLPLILFMMLLKKKKKKKKAESETQKLPPGPWKLPVIGSIHHLVGGGSLPHHTLRDLAKRHGPLMHLQMGEVPLVVASTPKTAKEIMKTHDLSFATRPEMRAAELATYGFTDVAFAPYGPYWRQMRKICMLELLTVKRVDSFSSIRKEEVLTLLSSIASSCNSPVNLTRKFYFLTNSVVTRAAFGAKSHYHDLFLSAMKDAMRYVNGFGVVDLFPSSKLLLWISGMKAKLKKNHKKLDHVLNHILEESRLRHNLIKKRDQVIHGDEEFEENLVDILLRLQQHENLEVPITDNNIKAIVLDMFTAGTETSATILGWAMSELMRNPRVMTKAQKEVRDVLRGKDNKVTEADIQQLPYLKLIVKETMRLHPPLPLLLPRENREKCQVLGYELPTHTKVIVNVWAIGRDPLYWGDDAETFKPERFADSSIDYKGTNFEFLPFGAGRRMCPGVAFGIASVELPLALLLYHFNWELPHGMGPENLDMTEDFGASVGRKSELYLVPNLCIPLPPK
ncbi:hypothetical protein H6P81_009900 [Aristolochia fimbriata]|uniref:Cytochrome P450 n=1 Tax=Aristolochia fimbriata TaxID=158543 RepID=A0AAV7EP94_ARIFI|nr:hypothetical protein H6P81_009900 [Aristolochia fimbriata]